MNDILTDFEPYKLPMHGVRLPQFQIEDKYKTAAGLKTDATNFEFLKALATQGFKNLKLEKNSELYKKYADRAKYELDIIQELGFVDYFLLVWLVINFCKENGIPYGPARGSAAGSVLMFLIGVIKIDPIKHGLYFERFISKTRAKKQVIDGITYLDGSLMVDVDLDICYYRRKEVIQFLDAKFPKRTGKILTLNTLSGKLLIKECGKIVGSKEEFEMNAVSDMVTKVHGNVADIEVLVDGVKNEDGSWKTEPIKEFSNWCNENREVYEIALKLRDLIKNKGVHASGVMVSYDVLEEICPVELNTKDAAIVSAFDMKWVSLLSVKLDCLGLRAVSVIDDVLKQLGKTEKDIDVNDPEIYYNLQDLKCPHGIFQLEAETNYRVSQKIKPKNLAQISATIATARPGAIQFVEQYAKYSNTGTADFESTGSKVLDKIMAETGGTVLYQESLMRIAHEVFGMSLEEAEMIRRATAKKKPEEMVKFESIIKQKSQELNIKKAGDFYWDILVNAADYSFNLSHSISYATLSATTVYLKFKHPKEFFLSLLKMTRFEPDPIGEISKVQKELCHFGIKLLPPHVLKSQMDFSIEGDNIRFGLCSIKGISDKSIEKLNNFKNEYSNKFQIFQGATDAGIPIGILSALIQAGALEGSAIQESRSRVVFEAQTWNTLTETEKKYCYEMGSEYNFDLYKILNRLKEFKNEKGKVIIKESRAATIRKKIEKAKEIYVLNKRSEDFANWYYESELLGYSFSGRLAEIFQKEYPDVMNVEQVIQSNNEEEVYFIGSVVETKAWKSKKGTESYKMVIKDETTQLDSLAFNTKHYQTIEHCKDMNGGKLAKEGDIVVVLGKKKEGNSVFINEFGIQNQRIYMKLRDLKDNKTSEKAEKSVDTTAISV